MPRLTPSNCVSYSKGDDCKPRPTSFNRLCCPKVMMACHTRRCRMCVLSKGGDVMPRPTLPTVWSVQEQ